MRSFSQSGIHCVAGQVVYHGEEDPTFGNTFASLGFTGFTGTITGASVVVGVRVCD